MSESRRGELRASASESSPRQLRASGSMEDVIAEVVERSARFAIKEALAELFEARDVERRKPTADPRLSTREVSERCGHVKEDTVRQWISSGRLKAERGGKRWLIRPEELERFLGAEGQSASPPSQDQMEDQVSRVLAKIHGGGKR